MPAWCWETSRIMWRAAEGRLWSSHKNPGASLVFIRPCYFADIHCNDNMPPPSLTLLDNNYFLCTGTGSGNIAYASDANHIFATEHVADLF